jgi:hypothetical protein
VVYPGLGVQQDFLVVELGVKDAGGLPITK